MKKTPFKFDKGQRVKIVTNERSSPRTLNRVRTHGPDFVLFKTVNAYLPPLETGSDDCVVVGSLATGWDGWLPNNEIEICRE